MSLTTQLLPFYMALVIRYPQASEDEADEGAEILIVKTTVGC
jgi:hypothetical protein